MVYTCYILNFFSSFLRTWYILISVNQFVFDNFLKSIFDLNVTM